jgi:rhamnogalacturonan endolyase
VAARSHFSCLVSPGRLGRKLSFEPLESRQMLSVATLTPVADTFTLAGVGAGTATVLDVLDGDGANDRMAYVRFDLSGLIIDDITSATLSFYKTAGSRNDTIVPDRFDVYGLLSTAGNTPQNWNESTLAEGNLGLEYTNTGGDQLDLSRVFNLDAESGANVTESVQNTDDTPQSITGPDLVSFLESRAADDGLVTFITLVDAGAMRGWGYHSREAADPAFRPTLELEFSGEAVLDPYPANPVVLPRQMERLDRGIIAMRTGPQIYVGWRMLGSDPADVAFNLYRSTGGGGAVKLNGTPLTETTDFVDTTADISQSNTYFVRPLIDGVEQAPSESYTLAAYTSIQQYLNVPLQIPQGGTVPLPPGTLTPPSGTLNYTYTANDASVGDLDGDGQYEIVLKWDPTNSQDNANEGLTGPVILDAYELDGTLLWRINLGLNIRAGAHYTQFLVYDFDGDGRAEVVMKTADGTVDGQGNVIGDPNADYRDGYTGSGDSRWGRVLSGPEYLTVFDGLTGEALVTTDFQVARGSVSSWGDNYGNRVDRFLAGVAYLDGVHPSIIMARGYYERTTLTAWNWRDGQLVQLWTFDSEDGTPGNLAYSGQGNHNLSVADVDGDGKDEIIYGACVIDDDGTGLYSTGLGHGDALHVSDMDPSNPGLEVFDVHESPSAYGDAGGEFRDALTGELLFGIPANNDVGRGNAFDIDPNYPGYEMWCANHDPSGAPSMIYSSQGEAIYQVGNAFDNFGIWWDADPLRELLDGTTIAKWRYDYSTPGRQNLVYAPAGLASNNGTKATPCLVADLFGDWREEVIWRRSDNTALQIWTTTIPSTMRLFTLMHDSQYREAVAWQNVAYNQPPHPSFFLGAGMDMPPQPTIFFGGELVGDYNSNGTVDAGDYTVWRDTFGSTTDLRADGNHDGTVDPDDRDIWKGNFGAVAAAPASSAFAGAVTSTSSFAAATAADGNGAAVQLVAEQPEPAGDAGPVNALFQFSGFILSPQSDRTLPAAKTLVEGQAEWTSVSPSDQSLLLLLEAPDENLAESLAVARTRAGDEIGWASTTLEPLDAVFEKYDLHLPMLQLT